MKFQAQRYHDISCGHTVMDHEGKCAHLHGHNYRIHFICESTQLDSVGRVVDFSVIKEKLCMWLELNWDHNFLVYDRDERAMTLTAIDKTVVIVPFNPTAENMAQYLVERIAPLQLKGTGVECVKVIVEETAKCSASWSNK